MTRNRYDRELAHLNQELAEMGHMVDESMQRIGEAMRKRDLSIAQWVIDAEERIDAMESTIEQRCMSLIIRQQPVAGDLRSITATLKIITDMERVADQCADIAELLPHLIESPALKAAASLHEMMDRARSMFVRALDCHIRRDEALARQVCDEDDIVDAAFSRIVMELVTLIGENPSMAYPAMDSAFIAKYIERMADHATNIAEWAIFVVTGTHPDLNKHNTTLAVNQQGG